MVVPDSALAGYAPTSSAFASTSVLPIGATPSTSATDPTDVSDEPPLSEEQQRVLRRVLAGESIFFTGPAGEIQGAITCMPTSSLA